ncbi:MAG: hypothetical protein ABF811_00140 [Pseudoclavibacter sp.]|jgi:FtsH-binding integral membrane protein
MSRIQQRGASSSRSRPLTQILPIVAAALLILSAMCMVVTWLNASQWRIESIWMVVVAIMPLIGLPLAIVAMVTSSILKVVRERRAERH